MAYTRKFNGKIYQFDSTGWSLEHTELRIKELKQQGYWVRRTTGSTFLTHTPYWEIWKRRKE